MSELLLHRMTSEQVKQVITEKKVLFVPFGTLEAHGNHLPVSTDTICAENLSIELARRLDGVVAPPLPYGITNQLFLYAAASRFKPETYHQFVEELVESFIAHGFTKIVLLNGHGGNITALNQITRDLSARHRAGVCVLHWWDAIAPLVKEHYGAPGGHAVAEETAAVHYFKPELVSTDVFTQNPRVYQCVPGLYVCPPPAACLIYEADGAIPQFDLQSNQEFMKKAIEYLAELLKQALDGWERMQL